MKHLVLFMLSSIFAVSWAQSFPYGACTSKKCDASPYLVNMLSVVSDTSLCFRIEYLPERCVGNCCAVLSNTFQKLVIKTKPECRASVKNVTVDRVRKGGGVYFDVYPQLAELRLTAFQSNGTMINGKVVCVNLADPCSTVGSFCDSTVECRVAIFDPFAHVCCPTCNMPISTPTPSLPIQSYRPPPPPPPPPPAPATRSKCQKCRCNCMC